MPKIKVFFIMLTLFSTGAQYKTCGLSGKSAWSQQLKYVVAECDNKIPSPNRLLVLEIKPNGEVQVSKAGDATKIIFKGLTIDGPSMAAWSPDSEQFLIDDERGSGEDGFLKLFRAKDGFFLEDDTFQKSAIKFYRNLLKCSANAIDPNVIGLGWSTDGDSLFVLVQATIHKPCGTPAYTIGIEMRRESASVLRLFWRTEQGSPFSAELPNNLKPTR